jgi:IS30 family transposase
MAAHATFTLAFGMPAYFGDPHSTWQRGTNENTNGAHPLIPAERHRPIRLRPRPARRHRRQAQHPPRKTIDYRTPAEALTDLLVATTT